MEDYILEAGGTSLCSVVAPFKGCGEKEIKFIEKMAGGDAANVAAQQVRFDFKKYTHNKECWGVSKIKLRTLQS